MNEKMQPPKQLILPELNLPLEYSIPYKWGALHVTSSANAAYDLVPLTPDTVAGGDPFVGGEVIKKPRIDVVLVGPNEYINDGRRGVASSTLYDAGLGVVIGFPLSANAFMDTLSRRLRNPNENQEEQDEFPFSTHISQFEVPALEAIARDVPHMMSHDFAVIARNELNDGLTEWNNWDYDRTAYRNIVKVGAAALIGCGGLMLPALLTGKHTVGVKQVVLGTALMAGELKLAKNMLKRYMLSRRQADFLNQRIASLVALEISDSIHETFCRNHFNIRAEQQMSAANPDN